MKRPWERDWLRVSPEQFEEMVVRYLRRRKGYLHEFEVQRRARISGPDGEFEIDAVASFAALGAQFVVIIECKHHRNPIKRELVQVLRDKVRSVSAQKGMLFSTSGFQRGAVEYAEKQGLALIHFTGVGVVFETRGDDISDLTIPKFEAHRVQVEQHGDLTYRFEEVDAASDV